MTRKCSPKEILSLLAGNDYAGLKGIIEDHRVECKGEPYGLQNTDKEKLNHYKQELAKDVSSFANSVDGGIIVIGAVTETVDSHVGDEIVDVRPLCKTLINLEQYLDVINSWIYPKVVGVEIRWFSSPATDMAGIAV